VVVLPDDQYEQFTKNMLREYDFIRQHQDEMYQKGDVVHCILVKGQNSQGGVLVNSEGGSYARYTAYLPAAESFLAQQALLEENGPQLREISQEELAMMYGQHILWAEGGDGIGQQAVFSNCLLSGLDLRGMQFNNAVFRDAVFEKTRMQGAGVCFSDFQRAQFVDCSLDGLCADEAVFRSCSFVGCSFRHAKLLHCNLSQAVFKDSTLAGTDLKGSCLEGMTVEAGVLEQADTRNVSFHECGWIEEAVSAKEPVLEMGGM